MSRSEIKRQAIQKGYRLDVRQLSNGEYFVIAHDDERKLACGAKSLWFEKAAGRATRGLDAA